MAEKAELDDPALAWAVRTADPGFDDWDAFQDWLESDASHASRFHAYSVDVTAMSDLLRHSSAPLADSAVATTRRSSLTTFIPSNDSVVHVFGAPRNEM